MELGRQRRTLGRWQEALWRRTGLVVSASGQLLICKRFSFIYETDKCVRALPLQLRWLIGPGKVVVPWVRGLGQSSRGDPRLFNLFIMWEGERASEEYDEKEATVVGGEAT